MSWTVFVTSFYVCCYYNVIESLNSKGRTWLCFPHKCTNKYSQSYTIATKKPFAHCLSVLIQTKFHDNLPKNWEIWSRHKNTDTNIRPSSVTLTLSKNGWLMTSVHLFSELNMWDNCHEIFSKNDGDMEWTQKKLKYATESYLLKTKKLNGKPIALSGINFLARKDEQAVTTSMMASMSADMRSSSQFSTVTSISPATTSSISHISTECWFNKKLNMCEKNHSH